METVKMKKKNDSSHPSCLTLELWMPSALLTQTRAEGGLRKRGGRNAGQKGLHSAREKSDERNFLIGRLTLKKQHTPLLPLFLGRRRRGGTRGRHAGALRGRAGALRGRPHAPTTALLPTAAATGAAAFPPTTPAPAYASLGRRGALAAVARHHGRAGGRRRCARPGLRAGRAGQGWRWRRAGGGLRRGRAGERSLLFGPPHAGRRAPAARGWGVGGCINGWWWWWQWLHQDDRRRRDGSGG